MNPSCPVPRQKIGWMDAHRELVKIAEYSTAEYVLLGDSIIHHFQRYEDSWKRYFQQKNINFGISGDRTQHVLWRVKYGLLPLHASVFIVHAGTNNISKNEPIHIAMAILQIATFIRQRHPKAKIVITGLLPRGLYPSAIRDDIASVNSYLEELSTNHHSGALYLKPENDWLCPNGTHNLRYYYKDKLHLIEEGYHKFSKYILKILASSTNCPPAAPTRRLLCLLRHRCHSPPPSSDDDDQSPAIQYLPRLRAVDFRHFDKLIS